MSRDPLTFSSGAHGADAQDSRRLVLINMDPPDHIRYRQLVSQCFSPRAVEALEPRVRAWARSLVDRLREAQEIDYVADLAAYLPLQVICHLLGIPDHDHELVLRWSNRLIAPDDPEFNESPEAVGEVQAAAFAYFIELAKDRRHQPGDDLITRLVEARLDGAALSDLEVGLFCILLLIGGNETTRNTLAHGLLALLRHPDERDRILREPDLSMLATDEMLRFGSALMQFTRIATTDTDVAGVRIAEGEQVRLWYVSANRDETVFEAANRFDVSRARNPHLSFGGGGPHICLGAGLARLEIRVMLEELSPYLGAIELSSAPVRLRSASVNGIKHLPIRLIRA